MVVGEGGKGTGWGMVEAQAAGNVLDPNYQDPALWANVHCAKCGHVMPVYNGEWVTLTCECCGLLDDIHLEV